MIFVDTIRKYQEYMEFDAAMELVVNECICSRETKRSCDTGEMGLTMKMVRKLCLGLRRI